LQDPIPTSVSRPVLRAEDHDIINQPPPPRNNQSHCDTEKSSPICAPSHGLNELMAMPRFPSLDSQHVDCAATVGNADRRSNTQGRERAGWREPAAVRSKPMQASSLSRSSWEPWAGNVRARRSKQSKLQG
jgi:hypothetical protein